MTKETNSFYHEKRPNGKVRFVRRYYDPSVNKIRRVSITYPKYTRANERQAYDLLGERIDKVLDGPTNLITFGELIDRWANLKKEQVKPSTFINTASRNNIIKKHLGHLVAERITDAQLNQFILYLQTDRQLSYTVAKQYHSQIEQILEYARLYEGIMINPNLIVQRINLSKKDDFKYLEKHELQSVVDQLRDAGDEETARYVLLQTLTGMRTGELSRLIIWRISIGRIEQYQSTRPILRPKRFFNHPKLVKRVLFMLTKKSSRCSKTKYSLHKKRCSPTTSRARTLICF